MLRERNHGDKIGGVRFDLCAYGGRFDDIEKFIKLCYNNILSSA